MGYSAEQLQESSDIATFAQRVGAGTEWPRPDYVALLNDEFGARGTQGIATMGFDIPAGLTSNRVVADYVQERTGVPLDDGVAAVNGIVRVARQMNAAAVPGSHVFPGSLLHQLPQDVRRSWAAYMLELHTRGMNMRLITDDDLQVHANVVLVGPTRYPEQVAAHVETPDVTVVDGMLVGVQNNPGAYYPPGSEMAQHYVGVYAGLLNNERTLNPVHTSLILSRLVEAPDELPD